MFKHWICRILALVFLTDILAPLPAVAQYVTPETSSGNSMVPTWTDLARQRPETLQEFIEKGGADEAARENDPDRQSELAKEVVRRHQIGKRVGHGSVLEARKEALQSAKEAVAQNNPVPTTPQERVMANESIRWNNSSGRNFVEAYNDAYEDALLKPLKKRLQSQDFTIDEFLDYIDPYNAGDYDPMITAVATETLISWLATINTNLKTDKDIVAGVAVHSAMMEQRILYRLAKLQSKGAASLNVNEVRALGSLRTALWYLYVFRKDVLTQFNDLLAEYGNDSIFVDDKVKLWDRIFEASLKDIEALAKALQKVEAESTKFEPLTTLIVYTANLALLGDRSGALVDSYGQTLPRDSWKSMDKLFVTLNNLNQSRRAIEEVPFGPYLQNEAALFAALGSFLEEENTLTKEDLTGSRGKQLIQMLKTNAEIDQFNGTPAVVTATQLAASFLRKGKISMSAEDKAFFASSVESIYCRSSVPNQSSLYDKNRLPKSLGISLAGHANKAQLYFESFGFDDPKQHAEFMRALAKIHAAFGVPSEVYKKVNPAVDHMVEFDEEANGTPKRRIAALPAGDFYYKCTVDGKLDTKRGTSSVMEDRETARIVGAIAAEVLVWVAFDGAFRIVGKAVGFIFRTTTVSVQALPKAIRAAGQSANKGRRTAAFGREFSDAWKTAGQMGKITKNGGTITATTTTEVGRPAIVAAKGARKGGVINTRHMLPGPGVANDAEALNGALVAERATTTVDAGTKSFSRVWGKWHSPKNRRFLGLGPRRKPITTYTLQQGGRSVELDAAGLGLENGIHSMRDWEKLFNAAKQQFGFEFKPLSGSALRAARADAYMTAAAVGRLNQGLLAKSMPGAKTTQFWRYAGEKEGWVSITREEFMQLQEAFQELAKKGSREVEDLYAVLGVPRNATTKEIQTAWREATKKVHPDHGVGENPFIRAANNAYNTLNDPIKRRAYDYLLASSKPMLDPLTGATRLMVPSSTEGLSLGITLNGKPFTVAEGIGFGEKAGNAFGDIITPVKNYMEETGMYYNQLGRQVSKLPQYWQNSFHGVTKTLPVMAGLDYVLAHPFQAWMSRVTQAEQEGVLAPFQSRLEKLKKAQEEANPGAVEQEPSIYQRIMEIEPSVINWLGVPCLSFLGASLGFGLFGSYKGLGLDKTFNYGLMDMGLFMSKAFGQDMGDPKGSLRNNAQFQILSGEVGQLSNERLMDEYVNSFLKPYRETRDNMLKEMKSDLGKEEIEIAERVWKEALADMEALLRDKNLAKREQDDRTMTQRFGDVFSSLVSVFRGKKIKMKHENQDENAIFERKFKEIQGPLEDFFTRVGLLLAYVRGKETMMKRYENFPEVQPIVSKSYDEFIAEAKKMFARPQMTAKEFEKWLQKEAEQLTAKHDQIPAQLVGEAAAAQIEQAPDALLMPMENINEEDQYILSWYFELINSVLDNFSDEAGLEINQLVQASVTKVRGVLANERLTEQRKRVQIYSIKQGLLNKVGAVLEKSDIKYAEIIEQALFVVVMQVNGTPAEKHIGKFVTEQLDQLAQWQESTKAMSVAKRKKSFDAFSNKFVDAVNEFGQQFGLTLLNSEESN